MTWILSYGCSSSAGPKTIEFWNSLKSGRDNSQPVKISGAPEKWPTTSVSTANFRSYAWRDALNEANLTAEESLVRNLEISWREILEHTDPTVISRVRNRNSLGVIFASTKGLIDDFIWEKTSARMDIDPLTPVLEKFLQHMELNPTDRICVSNACASAHSALYLANSWLNEGRVDNVLVLAADRVGPFVLQGFQSLRVLTQDRTRPFSGQRSGFSLGDAAAAILLSKQRNDSQLKLSGVGIDAEGYALTRPSQSGDSLKRACLRISDLAQKPPQVIIAHGTGTIVNDAAEDKVFFDIFGHLSNRPDAFPSITGTKWSIGHTLGASGAMDVIAACEALKRQEVFEIANTDASDSSFCCHYLTNASHKWDGRRIGRILTTSLGFGGVHAAAAIDLI